MESTVNDYLKILTQMPLSGAQGAFYVWQYKQARLVEVVSYKADKRVRAVVEQFLRRFTPKIKCCYETAAKCALETPGVDYIEGMAASVIPVGHAWNAIGDRHFDLTEEIALADYQKSGFSLTDYHQVIRLDRDAVVAAILKHRIYGAWAGEIFMEGYDGNDG